MHAPTRTHEHAHTHTCLHSQIHTHYVYDSILIVNPFWCRVWPVIILILISADIFLVMGCFAPFFLSLKFEMVSLNVWQSCSQQGRIWWGRVLCSGTRLVQYAYSPGVCDDGYTSLISGHRLLSS